ncbi:MAG: hypothetical protein ABSA41_17580 [Terriglobia bacterium]
MHRVSADEALRTWLPLGLMILAPFYAGADTLRKGSSQDSIKGHVTKYLLPHFGKMQVKDITEKEGEEFVAALAKMSYIRSNGTRRMLSATLIHNTVSVL